MHCAGCVRRTEAAATKLPGVSKASADLAGECLSVEFDDASLQAADIVTAVDKLGFQATLN
ncbi:MAG: hypothetical protein A2087_06750 [Spirochaetes bacterium GWD1_61_31]|nr:MAG: hypothetical protein A2Y37_08720 [Spirochaetes bacterium GWB1_60_80]OHD31855.1 MAG: hypothetical protein A2004_10100 [Spirochaetes bacterium GWC1_61_12]OHD40048.1 MAG: hypothetical protein A2087_06750 [Spirochaetes bacterium GWD1_61_31]OHD42298.1 MAG: hypothetical protein A2Y35_11250 [Spirochaetes bacterium GWE1_60_18]OHD58447.1 MAG: hypothetical protein A2Y32_06745 [Spirochaetes bacterium GWF1_60_12]